MSDNLSHNVDQSDSFDFYQQYVKNKGIDLAKDLEINVNEKNRRAVSIKLAKNYKYGRD